MNSLTINKKLAIGVFLFAVLAMGLSFVAPDGWNKTNERPNYISVLDLAERIKSRDKITILDLRSAEKYDTFHLPSAERFVDKSQIDEETEFLVFYGDNSRITSKFWSKLDEKIRNKSFVLYGGAQDWHEKLLYPKIPIKIEKQDSAMIEKILRLNKFYGGRLEMSDEHHLMDYYYLDMKKAKGYSNSRSGSLKRKGC